MIFNSSLFKSPIKLKVPLILIISIFIMSVKVTAQVGIGTVSPNPSSMLDISSTTKGFLPPRMTTSQRDAITPTEGLLIYNTTTNNINYYSISSWQVVGSESGSHVDLTSNQAINGDKTFYGTLTVEGRLMLPMGEISYFNFSGFSVPIQYQASGASGNDNMEKINPTGSPTIEFVNDMFGTGTNSRLTYTGATGRYFHIALSFSYTPGLPGDVYVFGVARNGAVEDSSKVFIKAGRINDHQSSALHVLLWLDQNDFIEFYVGNTKMSGSSINIMTFNFVAIGM